MFQTQSMKVQPSLKVQQSLKVQPSLKGHHPRSLQGPREVLEVDQVLELLKDQLLKVLDGSKRSAGRAIEGLLEDLAWERLSAQQELMTQMATSNYT